MNDSQPPILEWWDSYHRPMRNARILFVVGSYAVVRPATADMVWPALLLESRIFTWWAIGLGLLIEFFFVRWLFTPSLRKALIATVIANAVSALAGVPLIPIVGFMWVFFVYVGPVNGGNFNPIAWGATFLLACLITTGIEALVYRFGFKFRVGRREFFWLSVANSLSIGAALAGVFIYG